MDHLYNISPDGRNMMHTAEEIRAAARDGLRLWLNLGKHHAPAPCRLAATVSGWCTVVLEPISGGPGGIVQDWAGCFTVRHEEVSA